MKKQCVFIKFTGVEASFLHQEKDWVFNPSLRKNLKVKLFVLAEFYNFFCGTWSCAAKNVKKLVFAEVNEFTARSFCDIRVLRTQKQSPLGLRTGLRQPCGET